MQTSQNFLPQIQSTFKHVAPVAVCLNNSNPYVEGSAYTYPVGPKPCLVFKRPSAEPKRLPELCSMGCGGSQRQRRRAYCLCQRGHLDPALVGCHERGLGHGQLRLSLGHDRRLRRALRLQLGLELGRVDQRQVGRVGPPRCRTVGFGRRRVWSRRRRRRRSARRALIDPPLAFSFRIIVTTPSPLWTPPRSRSLARDLIRLAQGRRRRGREHHHRHIIVVYRCCSLLTASACASHKSFLSVIRHALVSRGRPSEPGRRKIG